LYTFYYTRPWSLPPMPDGRGRGETGGGCLHIYLGPLKAVFVYWARFREKFRIVLMTIHIMTPRFSAIQLL